MKQRWRYMETLVKYPLRIKITSSCYSDLYKIVDNFPFLIRDFIISHELSHFLHHTVRWIQIVDPGPNLKNQTKFLILSSTDLYLIKCGVIIWEEFSVGCLVWIYYQKDNFCWSIQLNAVTTEQA